MTAWSVRWSKMLCRKKKRRFCGQLSLGSLIPCSQGPQQAQRKQNSKSCWGTTVPTGPLLAVTRCLPRGNATDRASHPVITHISPLISPDRISCLFLLFYFTLLCKWRSWWSLKFLKPLFKTSLLKNLWFLMHKRPSCLFSVSSCQWQNVMLR